MNFDFSKIRPYNQSQNNGFEELVCQLAHLERPKHGKTFVRKEGAGGDAGIECYWELQDGSEIGWQAKYFLDGMDASKWGQLDKSFQTALNKHPNLSKYIVSIPLDKTDSRKSGKGGKTVISIEDEWNKRLDNWSKLALDNGRTIEFEFWGKHEICHLLTIDNPLYSGRALYWFQEPVLSSSVFESIAKKARESLGERYTPEFHIDLPIAHTFDGLGINKIWWETLTQKVSELGKHRDDFFNKFLAVDKEVLDFQKVKILQKSTTDFLHKLVEGINQRDFKEISPELNLLLDKIVKYENELYSYREKDVFAGKDSERATFRGFFSEYSGFNRFLQSASVQAYKIQAALVYGDPGIGKSHLLCDLSLHRIRDNYPTVFLLGSHYTGGNPIDLIKDALDLKTFRTSQVLGALDAAGEAKRSRTLIVIDAINEGGYREEWFDQIRAFISELAKFKNLSLLMSCRTSYLKYILPDTINNENLVRFHHLGFQGYEHRAAEKYLSQQGISKPSAPILAPEFTNPLFLKTCCQALKTTGATAFPKGLQGITSLFDFYIQSVEKTIAQKKFYNPSEEIFKACLTEIASRLFPDDLIGISIAEARNIVNDLDPNPNKGDSLFDELLNEGIISEDISYKEERRGKPVIRFTYERFSDHFVAKQLIESYSSDDIGDIFKTNQPLGKLIYERSYYGLVGIFEALAILLAEQYKLELIDLLPEDNKIDGYILNDLFSRTVIWRSVNSFSDRTLELLNSLDGYDHPALDIFLKLSTEPNHPWNAELLHRNLLRLSMSQRDFEWSIHIADGYYEEEDGESESIVRTLIEWSCFGDISSTEKERIRLCAVTLMWFLTTSNRKIRDQATKSLVRLLVGCPSLLEGLIEKFCKINDLYLVERLYAVAYGVICHCKQIPFLKRIAKKVFDLVFAGGEPIPHILLRDYARGIMEFALFRKALPENIDPEKFRPPYKSEWPLENPTEADIESLVGDKFSSLIRSSLMGFPGDFGNYTMSSIHDWSPTPLIERSPKTGRQYKAEFAETYLKGEIKDKYLARINPPEELNKSKDKINIIGLHRDKIDDGDKYLNAYIQEQDTVGEEKKKLSDDINKLLDEEGKEHFRWVSGVWDDRTAAFSRKWAQRWVCKRVYSFGWTEELFKDFERSCSFGRGSGYGESNKERIGKKYQWIAFYEFLAHLSDNVHWIDRGYSDLIDEEYYGPWQLHRRDIDPTIWMRESGENSYFNEKKVWWQKFHFPVDDLNELPDKIDFLWSEEAAPDFKKILTVSKSGNDNEWTILSGNWHQHQKDGIDKDVPKLDAWFRINSLIIDKNDYEKVASALKGISLVDPYTVPVETTQYQTFLGEYPWHPSINYVTGFREPEENFRNIIPVKHFVPISEYEWEKGNSDHSLNESIRIYLPSKELINDLNLSLSEDNFGAWLNENGEVEFLDPSVKEKGASFALIKTYSFQKWLDERDMEILWLIGGEKMLCSSFGDDFFGRLTFNGLYRRINGKITGDIWFEEEKPKN